MTKPNDIPQDVWGEAGLVVKNEFGSRRTPDFHSLRYKISRSIMAAKEEEREECVIIAEDWIGGAEYIAAAIRNRKLANNTNKD